MEREIINVDEEKCNGCGKCVPKCHEGALQVIDGKARLVSDLMCDGIGACIGYCPEGAIKIELRESEPYDEHKVMELLVTKGYNTVVAHLQHLKQHDETVHLKQGMSYLTRNEPALDFRISDVKVAVHHQHNCFSMGGLSSECKGSENVIFDFSRFKMADKEVFMPYKSQLTHWPLQLHLINPKAIHFKESDLLVAADCSAFAVGDFHEKWLKNKTLVIACPKLDRGKEMYIQKIISLIDHATVNTITVLTMEVSCCGGLLQIIEMANSVSQRKIPIKSVVVSITGELLREEWI